jgi:hypothetical protein
MGILTLEAALVELMENTATHRIEVISNVLKMYIFKDLIVLLILYLQENSMDVFAKTISFYLNVIVLESIYK